MRRLVDDWEASRRERTGITTGERVASVEQDLDGPMRPVGVLRWLLGAQEPEQEPDDEEREAGG